MKWVTCITMLGRLADELLDRRKMLVIVDLTGMPL